MTIKRHKTALKRFRLSKPMAMAVAEGLVSPATTVFDYGCGRGDDVRLLVKLGVKASGWDPHFKPKSKRKPASVVNLGYVLNVVEDPMERTSVLRDAFDLATALLVVSVRVDRVLDDCDEYSDGLITDRGTFQKIYSQDEFRLYVEGVCGKRMHGIAPGIAFVFRDEEMEARFLASRAWGRTREYRAEAIAEFHKDRLAKKLVVAAEKLGRLPTAEEFRDYPKIIERFGSLDRIRRLVLHAVDRESFEGSRSAKKDDILVYLAMMRLQGLKLPPFGVLPDQVQADIKTLWGSYREVCDEGEAFLFSMGNPEVVKATCTKAGLGKLLPEDLYIHRSLEAELPPLLRVILFAAKQLAGEMDYDVVKISLDGRAISFLSYPGFDQEAHPALARSIRVYLPRAHTGLRTYEDSENPPILHRKDALVGSAYPFYSNFRELTLEEERLCLLGSVDIGFKLGWEAALSAKGFSIVGQRILPIVPRQDAASSDSCGEK